MTREEIDAMEAGESLDRLVHKKIMRRPWNESRCRICGWPLGGACTGVSCSARPVPRVRADEAHPRYSEDITAAMDVLCKARGPEESNFTISTYPGKGYLCGLYFVDGGAVAGVGKTISEAVCKAALLAAEKGGAA